MALLEWLKRACGEERLPTVHVPEGPGGPAVRRRYRFAGTVQGVGFRYTAMLTADRLGVTGWARNESDGTVLLEAEGGADRLDEFLRAMKAVPRFHITSVQTEDLPPLGMETDFQARY